MFLKYINNLEKWKEFLNYKLFSLYSYRKEKRLLTDFIENEKFRDICSKLENTTYSFSIPKKVFINKGNTSKKRVVYKFLEDEVIVLKYISYLLYDYDYLFCNNLYSFRKDITMKDAIYKIKGLLNENKLYAYKVDISDYFNSINSSKLLDMLSLDIKDKDLFNVIKSIIGNKYTNYNEEILEENKGILAGCPISAFLANYYLNDLEKYKNFIKSTLKNLDLCINNDKEVFYDIDSSIEFLGFTFKNNQIDISSNSINKAKARIRRCSKNIRRKIKSGDISVSDGIILMIKSLNKKFYGNKREELSWKYWFFPVITCTDGIDYLDQYYQEQLRYLASGKHNKKNYKLVPYSKLKSLGYKSLVSEYYSFKKK